MNGHERGQVVSDGRHWHFQCRDCLYIGEPHIHPLDCGEDGLRHALETAIPLVYDGRDGSLEDGDGEDYIAACERA